jgi:hypothetical protein
VNEGRLRWGIIIRLAVIIFVLSLFALRALADSGVTNDPDRLEMIITERAMDVTAVQPDPKGRMVDKTCQVTRMGDRCHLAKGINLMLRGTDRTYVLLEYLAYGDPKDTTCPIGTMVLMTRQEFARRAAPQAVRRLSAEKLLATVQAIIKKGRKW